MSDLKSQLLEAWAANELANERLLDLLDDEILQARYAPRVRTVGLTLIHLHNVRRMWLGAGGKVPENVPKIDRKASMTVEQLRLALQGSGSAVRDLLALSADKGKVPGFKKSPVTFLGYLLAHEAHHRGQIMATMRISGKKNAPEDIYGLWEWG